MIKIIENINDFETIKKDCNRLADNLQMPLLRYEWLVNCALVLSPEEKLFVIVYYLYGRVKAIAPLVVVKKKFVEKLEFLGASLLNEPAGILYDDEHSLLEILKEINKSGRTFIFNRIRDLSAELVKLRQLPDNRKKIELVNTGRVPYLPVSCSYESYEQNISSSRRSSLRRLMRIAVELGNLSIEITTPPPDAINIYLDEIFDVEASGWKKRMGTAMRTNSRLGKFFFNYAKEAAKLEMLKLCVLRINQTAVAALVGIEYSDRFWILKIGYDEKFAKCSPGILLMNDVIAYVFSKNFEALEFLGSYENWLNIWTKNFHRTYTYRIYNSLLTCFLDVANSYTGRLFNKIHLITSRRRNKVRDLVNA